MKSIPEQIAEKMKYLDEIQDNQERCKRVSKRYIDMGRQLGKTTLMMKSLKEGDRILSWRAADMKEKVQQMRPDLDVSKIDFRSVRNLEELSKFSGASHTLIDNALWDCILSDLIEEFYSGKMFYEAATEKTET